MHDRPANVWDAAKWATQAAEFGKLLDRDDPGAPVEIYYEFRDGVLAICFADGGPSDPGVRADLYVQLKLHGALAAVGCGAAAAAASTGEKFAAWVECLLREKSSARQDVEVSGDGARHDLPLSAIIPNDTTSDGALDEGLGAAKPPVIVVEPIGAGRYRALRGTGDSALRWHVIAGHTVASCLIVERCGIIPHALRAMIALCKRLHLVGELDAQRAETAPPEPQSGENLSTEQTADSTRPIPGVSVNGDVRREYFSIKEAAKYLHISCDTVRPAIKDGKITAENVGKLIRLHGTEVAKLAKPRDSRT